MATLNITIEQFDHAGHSVKIAQLSGSADATNVHDVNDAMLAVIEEVSGTLDVIIDGSGLDYINSTAIGYLTDWYSRVTATGGSFILTQLHPNVFDTLSVVGLMNIIPHYGSLDEAKLALTNNTTTAGTLSA